MQPEKDKPLKTNERVNLNDVVLETPLLKQIVHKQMSALVQRGENPDWITYTRTDIWMQMLPVLLPEARLRYELQWRIAYKSGPIQQALMNHKPTAGLEMFGLAGHAMVYIWRELCNDNPDFEPLMPSLTPYRLSILNLSEIRLKVAGLIGDDVRRVKVIKLVHPEEEAEPGTLRSVCPVLIMTRPDGDVDLVDYERAILEGYCPFTELRWEDTNELDTPATNATSTPGIIIGSADGRTCYQRMENGSLVNITKNPEKRRRDLEETGNASPSKSPPAE